MKPQDIETEKYRLWHEAEYGFSEQQRQAAKMELARLEAFERDAVKQAIEAERAEAQAREEGYVLSFGTVFSFCARGLITIYLVVALGGAVTIGLGLLTERSWNAVFAGMAVVTVLPVLIIWGMYRIWRKEVAWVIGQLSRL